MRPFLPALLLTILVGFCPCSAQAQWAVQDQNGIPIPNSYGPYELYEEASGHATNTYPSNMLADVQAGRASYNYLSCFDPSPDGYYYPYDGPDWDDGLMTGCSYNLYAYVAARNAAYFSGSSVGSYNGTPLTGSVKLDISAPLFANFLWSPLIPAPPPPALGVLVTSTLSSYVREYYPSSGPATGLSGNVTSSAYFGNVGDTLIADSNTVDPLSLVGRHTIVLPVAAGAATLTGQSHVISSANCPIPYSVPAQNGQPATVNGGEVVYSDGIASATVSPIVLTAPNPMGRPDLGDGTNQFVYDTTTPQGYLFFPGAVNVVGGNADDTAWLMREPQASPHVALTVDLPTESVEKDRGLTDHTLLASVPDSALVVKYGSFTAPGPGDGFQFLGLPNKNTSSGTDIGFGNHLVTLKVDGHTSQQAHIQTFFSALASNYPGTGTDYTASSTDSNQRFYTPNWYHYYNQAYTATGKYNVDHPATASHIDLLLLILFISTMMLMELMQCQFTR